MAVLRDVLRGGALAVGRFAAQLTGDYWAAYRAIRDLNTGLTPAQLRRAASIAYGQARDFARNPESRRARAARPLRATANLPSEAPYDYRYIVEVTWTEEDGTQRTSGRLGINSDVVLSAEELRARAIERASRLRRLGESPRGDQRQEDIYTGPGPDAAVTLYHFLARPETNESLPE